MSVADDHLSAAVRPARRPTDAAAPASETARASRLQWLLRGVLDVQRLVTEPEFNLESFMARVVDLAETMTGARGAVIELVEGDEMVYRSASPSISEHLGLRLRRESSLSGLCVAERAVLRCEDSETDPRVDKEACRRVGVRSMLCTPLFEAGHAVGVLKVMGSEPKAFDSDDEYLLGLLAGALGAALGRQLAVQELQRSEEIFRTAMEMASIGMAIVKIDGRFLKVNASLCASLGYSEEELLANDFQSITHTDDLGTALELRRKLLAGEIDRYQMEKRYYHKSGRIIWVLLSVSLARDRAGQPRYFLSQIQDISERREMERVKNEFISVVSHELRTPLTSIRGSLGLLLGSGVEGLSPKAVRLLEIANGNCERLIRLVSDILDIDRIASGQMRFDIQQHALADVIHKAALANEAFAQRFNVRIAVHAPETDIIVAIDEDRMLQVLSNLLSNAAKFSPPGESIDLRAELRGERVRISVADRGPGIPEDFRDRIFGKFSQADSSATRQTGGAGLGLHITRQIVARLGGEIGFDTVVGRGATFWVELPTARID